MSDEKEKKDKWFPGKYMSRMSKRRSLDSGSFSSSPETRTSFSSPGEDVGNKQVDSQKQSTHFEHSLEETIGVARLTIVDIKYLRITGAKICARLGRSFTQWPVEDSGSFQREFALHDIVGDIVITVGGKGDNGDVNGIIVIPLTSLLTFGGKPQPPKDQWRLLYSVSSNQICEGRSFKFISGYSDLPGFALNRAREPLGFVCVRVEVVLNRSPLACYLSPGNWTWKQSLAYVQNWVDQECQDEFNNLRALHSNAELCAMLNRDVGRIWNVPRLPHSISGMLSLPELVVITLFIACMCFVLDTWQFPVVAVLATVLNGLLSMNQRSFANLVIWNDPTPLTFVGTPADPNHAANVLASMDPTLFLSGATVPTQTMTSPPLSSLPLISASVGASLDSSGETGEAVATGVNHPGRGSTASNSLAAELSFDAPASAGKDASGSKDRSEGQFFSREKLTAILKGLQQQNIALVRIVRVTARTAHLLEAFVNLFCFADPRATLIVFGFLLSLTACYSISLMLLPRISLFVLITTSIIACACSGYFIDAVEYKSSEAAASAKVAGAVQMKIVCNALDCIAAFLSRVPDEMELIHRYIATTAVVNVNGSEMSEAAVAFEKKLSTTAKT